MTLSYPQIWRKVVCIHHNERRSHCFGHILNLAARDLLFGTDKAAFESDNINMHDDKVEEENFKRWVKMRPVGKAHNFVHFIHQLDQCRELFRSVQIDILKRQ